MMRTWSSGERKEWAESSPVPPLLISCRASMNRTSCKTVTTRHKTVTTRHKTVTTIRKTVTTRVVARAAVAHLLEGLDEPHVLMVRGRPRSTHSAARGADFVERLVQSLDEPHVL